MSFASIGISDTDRRSRWSFHQAFHGSWQVMVAALQLGVMNIEMYATTVFFICMVWSYIIFENCSEFTNLHSLFLQRKISMSFDHIKSLCAVNGLTHIRSKLSLLSYWPEMFSLYSDLILWAYSPAIANRWWDQALSSLYTIFIFLCCFQWVLFFLILSWTPSKLFLCFWDSRTCFLDSNRVLKKKSHAMFPDLYTCKSNSYMECYSSLKFLFRKHCPRLVSNWFATLMC